MNDYNIEVLNLNNYITPVVDIILVKVYHQWSKQWLFKYIKDRYNGSPTNAGIINSYVNYIIGEGLIEISNFNINKYI
jgi:hypothetical protein